MSQTDIKTMQEVTYLNEDTGCWGFYGCEVANYDTQKDAFDSYKNQ